MYRRSRIAFVSGDSLKLNELKGKEEEELQNEDSKTTTGNHSLQRRLTSEKDDRLSFLTGPMLCRSESREVSTLKVRMLRNIAEKKIADLNAYDLDSAISIISGSARSMGVKIIEN